MVWVCKQHGKSCQSYVVGICKDFNNWRITPNNTDKLNAEQHKFLKCVKWVEEKMSEDYCVHCGCPKDICCGQGKVSLEWLEKELENLDFYDFLDYHGNVWQEKIKEILLEAARKQAGDV